MSGMQVNEGSFFSNTSLENISLLSAFSRLFWCSIFLQWKSDDIIKWIWVLCIGSASIFYLFYLYILKIFFIYFIYIYLYPFFGCFQNATRCILCTHTYNNMSLSHQSAIRFLSLWIIAWVPGHSFERSVFSFAATVSFKRSRVGFQKPVVTCDVESSVWPAVTFYNFDIFLKYHKIVFPFKYCVYS
jgi:hypothetical protein